jgi:hypothetical protein
LKVLPTLPIAAKVVTLDPSRLDRGHRSRAPKA